MLHFRLESASQIQNFQTFNVFTNYDSSSLKAEYNKDIPSLKVKVPNQKTIKLKDSSTLQLQDITSRCLIPVSLDKRPENFETLITSKQVENRLPTNFKYQRIGIKVNGLLIDTTLIKPPTCASSKRWTLISLGGSEMSEMLIADKVFLNFIKNIKSNALIFNYPGVGASTGKPLLENMLYDYKGTLSFLENYIGAKEIIGYGRKLGGTIQAAALKTNPLKEGSVLDGVKYLFIKEKSFFHTDLFINVITGGFVKCSMGIDALTSSFKMISLNIPEILIESTEETKDKHLKPVFDGFVDTRASYRQGMLHLLKGKPNTHVCFQTPTHTEMDWDTDVYSSIHKYFINHVINPRVTKKGTATSDLEDVSDRLASRVKALTNDPIEFFEEKSSKRPLNPLIWSTSAILISCLIGSYFSLIKKTFQVK